MVLQQHLEAWKWIGALGCKAWSKHRGDGPCLEELASKETRQVTGHGSALLCQVGGDGD